MMAKKAFMGAVLLVLLPGIAVGETVVSAAGGVFTPYSGSTGFSGVVQVLSALTDSNLRVGGEIEYRGYKTEIFDVDDVGIDTISLRAVVQYVLLKEPIRPYIGAGLGLGFNIIDGDKVEEERDDLSIITDFGVGVGVLGLVGVEVPLGQTVALFAEARAGADFQLTGESGELDAVNLGGVSGLGGIRFRF